MLKVKEWLNVKYNKQFEFLQDNIVGNPTRVRRIIDGTVFHRFNLYHFKTPTQRTGVLRIKKFIEDNIHIEIEVKYSTGHHFDGTYEINEFDKVFKINGHAYAKI